MTRARHDHDEQDWAPHPDSVAWWRWRKGEGWTRHVRAEPPPPPAAPGRRLRGDQSYEGLHLGRGTRWVKR